MHTTSLFSCLVPLGAALGDGRKSQVRGTTNERRAVCSETRMSSTEDVVGLKFCWSPTRLYRRVERVGTTAEPPTIDGGESQVNCSEPLQLNHSHVVLNTPPQSKGAVPHLPSPAGR